MLSKATISRYCIYLLLSFSLIFGGALRFVGAFSFRHVCMLTLFFFIFVNMKKVRLFIAAKLYLVYLGVYLLANVVNGEVGTHHFIQSLYTYHLPSLAIILSFPLLVKDKHDVRQMGIAITMLYVFNSVVTILQYTGNSTAWAIGSALSENAAKRVDRAEDMLAVSDDLFGYALVTGILGFAVTNGYWCASYFPVAVKRLFGRFDFGWIMPLLITVLAFVTVFVIQQRTAFYMVIAYALVMLAIRMSPTMKGIAFFAAFLFLAFGSLDFSYDIGRLEMSGGIDSRVDLSNHFNSFLNSPYMMFGGYENYVTNFGMAQHNAFTSAWVLGGVFSFLAFAVLFVYLLLRPLRVMARCIVNQSNYVDTLAYGSASVMYLLYSMLHSDGVQSGSPMFWVAFTMFIISFKLEQQKTIPYAKKTA